MVLPTAPVSLAALAWGWVGMELFSLLVLAAVSQRLLGYGLLAQLRDLAPFLALTVFMAVAVGVQRGLLELDSNIGNLLLSTAVGMVAYLAPLAFLRPAMLQQVLRPFKG